MAMLDSALLNYFRVEHPTAEEVFLTGDFLDWRIPGMQMRRVAQGLWELSVNVPAKGKGLLSAAALVAGRVVDVFPIKPHAMGSPEGEASADEQCESTEPAGSF